MHACVRACVRAYVRHVTSHSHLDRSLRELQLHACMHVTSRSHLDRILRELVLALVGVQLERELVVVLYHL